MLPNNVSSAHIANAKRTKTGMFMIATLIS
jgi:hypothetical protein